MDSTDHTKPGTHAVVRCPCLAVARVAQCQLNNGHLLLASALMLTTSFVILDELQQANAAGRFTSLTDIALNTPGAAFAIWLISRPAYSKRLSPP